MTPVLVFDIETVPDIEGLRKLNDLGVELAAADVAEMGRRTRSSPRPGKPVTWRRGPA